jgi:hypothetical protein
MELKIHGLVNLMVQINGNDLKSFDVLFKRRKFRIGNKL